MLKQSLALDVLALSCFLCFTPFTQSLAVGTDGKQVGPLVFDDAKNYPMKHKLQNYGLSEPVAAYQQEDPEPVKAILSTTASAPPPGTCESENQCRWCIAKPSTSAAKLDEIIQYCCTQHGIDCGLIQYGGACYSPAATNKVSDASVVMNLYYKLAGENDFSCYFGGSGLIVTQDPSVGECFYA